MKSLMIESIDLSDESLREPTTGQQTIDRKSLMNSDSKDKYDEYNNESPDPHS